MNLDKTDILIMREMWIADKITTTELAKRVFKPKNRYELQDKTSHIIKRLNKLVKYGLVFKETVDGKTYYFLNFERCYFGVRFDDSIIWVNLMYQPNSKRK